MRKRLILAGALWIVSCGNDDSDTSNGGASSPVACEERTGNWKATFTIDNTDDGKANCQPPGNKEDDLTFSTDSTGKVKLYSGAASTSCVATTDGCKLTARCTFSLGGDDHPLSSTEYFYSLTFADDGTFGGKVVISSKPTLEGTKQGLSDCIDDFTFNGQRSSR